MRSLSTLFTQEETPVRSSKINAVGLVDLEIAAKTAEIKLVSYTVNQEMHTEIANVQSRAKTESRT